MSAVLAAAGDVAGLPPWVAIVGGIGSVVGAAKLLQMIVNAYLERRATTQTRADARADEERVESRGVVQTVVDSSGTMLEKLTEQIDARLEDYKAQIERMRDDQAELRRENRQLERRLEDVQRTLHDYQLGIVVPRGMVLLPLIDVRQVREGHPGVLPRPWYVGEDDTGATV